MPKPYDEAHKLGLTKEARKRQKARKETKRKNFQPKKPLNLDFRVEPACSEQDRVECTKEAAQAYLVSDEE